MKLKITGKYHLTATEKNHIRQIIENGWLAGGTKRKTYQLEQTQTGFTGKVFTLCRNDYGAKIFKTQSFTVETL